MKEGWICPRCGCVNSPDQSRCYELCHKQGMYENGTSDINKTKNK